MGITRKHIHIFGCEKSWSHVTEERDGAGPNLPTTVIDTPPSFSHLRFKLKMNFSFVSNFYISGAKMKRRAPLG